MAWLDTQVGGADQQAGVVALSVITGTAGVGKSALAVHWAHRRRDWFPDGQLYVDMHGYSSHSPVTAAQALEGFLHALNTDPELVPATTEGKAALYRSLTDGRKLLVLIDNVSHAGQVRPLVAGCNSVTVVVTSRTRLAGLVSRHGATRMSLDVLTEAEAVALLRSTAGAQRIDGDPANAVRLAAQCAHLPLALRVAAERCADTPHTTLADLTTELTAEQDRLDLLSSGEDATAAVRAVLSWSYQALPSDAAEAFRVLGLHPTPTAGLEAIAILLDVPPPKARQRMDTLVAAHLVDQTDRTRYRLHDLLRAYAAERAQTEQPAHARAEATHRMLAWYLHTADAADRALLPLHRRVRLPDEDTTTPLRFTDRATAMQWCETERINLVTAVRLAADTGLHDIACHFPAVLWSFFDLRKHWTDWIDTYEIALTSARLIGHQYNEAWILSGLGVAHYDTGQFGRAVDLYHDALAIRREIEDLWGEAGTLANLASAYRQMARHPEALDCLHRSLALRESLDDARGQAVTLNRLAAVYRDLDRLDESLDHLNRSLDLRQQIGDRHGEGFAHHGLAATYKSLRQFDTAIRHHQASIDAHHEVGNRRGEAEGLECLGTLLHQTGHSDAARKAWQQAVEIFDAIGSQQADEVRTRIDATTHV